MASKRTAPRKTSGKGTQGKTREELKELLKKAQAEIEKLLKRDQAGTLTRAKLRAGLEEIEEDLEEMEPLEKGA
jgi:predicted ribonuclease toxin of YeeF-YezG toxin-antitoxin module